MFTKQVELELENFPGICYSVHDHYLFIHSASNQGFDISVGQIAEDRFLVTFSYWHAYFSHAAEAINMVMLGLSDSCRLQVKTLKGESLLWTPQYSESGQWISMHSATTLYFEFGQAGKPVQYLQNCVIKYPELLD